MNEEKQAQPSSETDSVDVHDRVAEAYLGLMGQQFMRKTQHRIHWICRQIQGKQVLDVGCSQGIVPILLAREGLKVIGIDSSPKSIDEANHYLEGEPKQVRKNVSFINTDFLSWDVHDLKVDTVVMSEVLEHLTRPECFIETAAHILAKKGRLIVTVPFGVNDFIDHKQTFYLLEPLRLISKYFDPANIEVLGNWLGIVADRRVGADRGTEIFRPTIALMEKLESAFYQTERGLQDELSLVRTKQNDANQKYRVANEQIAALKQQVAQEEKAHQAAKQVPPQQQSMKATAEGRAKQVEVEEETKSFLRLEAELEATRNKLGEANQKYRGANEQITALKQQLVQVTAEGQAKTVAAEESTKNLLRLEAELEGMRSKLGEANQKYLGANEQITALKQRVTQEETVRQTAEQALAQVTTQLEQAQSYLQEERTGLLQQVAQLSQQEQVSRAAAEEYAKNLLRLEAELEAARSKLGEANQKYRGANEQIIALKQQVTQEETARQTAEQALAKASDESAKILLRLEAEVEAGRTRLAEANQKYRGAGEQITVLKQQVTQEEVARQTAEQALTQITTQLEQTQGHLQTERAALQQQLVQLTAEGQAKWVAVQEAEGNLLRRETELERMRSKLGEANQKYRGANEQIIGLKQQVTQEEVARQTAEQALTQITTQLEQTQGHLQTERAALQQQLAVLTAEGQAKQVAADEAAKRLLHLETEAERTRSKLEEANQKYRAAGEQITVLKQRVAKEETACQAAEQALAQATTLWEETQSYFQKERVALQQQLAVLTAEGQAKQVAADEAAKRLLHLETEAERTRSKLEEANQKYRAAGEQITVLKQRVAKEETACQAAEQALAQATTLWEETQSYFQKERVALQQQLAVLTAEGQAKQVAADEAAKRLLHLETELEATRNKLGEANQKYRSATEQVTALKQRVAEAESTCEAAEQALAQVMSQGQAKNARVDEATRNVIRLETELAGVSDKLEEANQKCRGTEGQIAELKQRVMREETARRTTEQDLQQATRQLEQANSKYRQVMAVQIPELKSKIDTESSKAREGQHTLEQLRLRLQTNGKALAETNRQFEKMRQQKIVTGHQLEKARASISFQTGYQLIHGFKSVNSVLRLPSALWALRKEALRRRKKHTFVPRSLTLSTLSEPSPAPHPKPSFSFKPNVFIEPRQHDTSSNGHATSEDPTVAVLPASALATTSHRLLSIACIMDEFTVGAFQPEARLQQLTPTHWRAELEAAPPDLLFIESAWRGKDELWGNKVGHTSTELQGIVTWCRAQHIPTVFWCKEDPIHFDTFLNTAKLFDYVFTTDIDCIHRYKAALGHDRVYLLPFACQPATNNPIETYPRKDAFCFAGAYYVRYPERTRDLGDFVLELPAFRPLEIYDRNYGKQDLNYQFPVEYQPYIIGTLPFDQIDKAYKGYRYAINLNSIKQSQSMFARRVFELLASNTITISNFSRGLRLLFGELVITSDSGAEIVRRLKTVAHQEAHSRKLRLAGLRKVMREHTYGQRLAYVVAKVSGKAVVHSWPHIAVLAYATDHTALTSLLAHYHRQGYVHTALYVVVGVGVVLPANEDTRVHLLTREQAQGRLVGEVVQTADLVAGLVAEDYYGPNYLEDIALATRYTQAEVIGKAAHYGWVEGRVQLTRADEAYRLVPGLPARAAAIRRQVIAQEPVLAWVQSLGTRQLQTEHGLAIDEFNYCAQGAAAEAALLHDTVDDLPGLQTGISIDDLLATAERIAPERPQHEEHPLFTGAQLATDFGKRPSGALTLAVEGATWRVASTLPDGKHESLFATTDHSLDELGVTDQLKVYFEVTPGLNLQLVILFLDAQKQKIDHVTKQANRNQEVGIPAGTQWLRFGLRVYAGGQADIRGLVFGHKNLQPAEIFGQAAYLLLTNQYPSYDDLYRNAFVHSRVRAYRAQGVHCDVFRLRPDEAVAYHEFEDVNVISGAQEVLHRMLASGRYSKVLVHFLDAAMWAVLQHHIDRIQVVVWVHGAEIQPWHRRSFDHQAEEQRAGARRRSDERMAFWRELLQPVPINLKLVFVSRYFAEEVMEDLGFRIPDAHYTVIHNPIDTELFSYQEKSIDQRKKVLSIRPYASAKYANDLSVGAIQRLSQQAWFYDMEFRMIGDGPLFEEIIAPLREFRNVYIEQRFLNQQEIAALHKEYGIFLSPTRMDAQGVSRDEAMASGLVPVTNAVTAIPEFVDDHCGILAPGEDADAMARGIALMYEQPQKFAAMSKAAASRVRAQSDAQRVICAELALVLDNSEQTRYRLIA